MCERICICALRSTVRSITIDVWISVTSYISLRAFSFFRLSHQSKTKWFWLYTSLVKIFPFCFLNQTGIDLQAGTSHMEGVLSEWGWEWWRTRSVCHPSHFQPFFPHVFLFHTDLRKFRRIWFKCFVWMWLEKMPSIVVLTKFCGLKYFSYGLFNSSCSFCTDVCSRELCQLVPAHLFLCVIALAIRWLLLDRRYSDPTDNGGMTAPQTDTT